ncbi:hypothetical protein J4558_08380 [Leptolyngbya sp. 15MV]|nr:hypothetical protein J4558_08380 [Leptolyngbya sp. 15MV]
MAARVAPGRVLAIDSSPRAITQAIAGFSEELAVCRLSFRVVAAEEFRLLPSDRPFDLIGALRVNALDGRHPDRSARLAAASGGARSRRSHRLRPRRGVPSVY